MQQEDLRIVFMGTPTFAVESLKQLVENHYRVVGVITMPDKAAGRGHKLQLSPVKQYALEQGIPVLQPERLKDEVFLAQLQELNADLQVVVAFRMLPELVWNMPRLGTFNLHASLLPHYRGAAPINWAIINGETETGATTFFLTHEIDTGKVILQQKIDIAETDNAGSVHDKLMTMGAGMVVRTVDQILQGNLDAVDQQQLVGKGEEVKMAPKIFRETCQIGSGLCVKDALNLVRGLSPYPTAWVNLSLPAPHGMITLKVYEAEIEVCSNSQQPGSFATDGKKKAGLVLNDGTLWFKSVQAPAKKRMAADEWLRGLRL